jgi:hypothetical protein
VLGSFLATDPALGSHVPTHYQSGYESALRTFRSTSCAQINVVEAVRRRTSCTPAVLARH